MLKHVLILSVIITIPTYATAQTRGDSWDKSAAIDVSRCYNQYSHLTTLNDRHEYWQMCLEVAAELTGRPIQNIKRRVIQRQKIDVFRPVSQ